MDKHIAYFHALRIVENNCVGCTQCVGVCPTEALRVRDGLVRLTVDRCIDCGRCIKACRYNAVVPVADTLMQIHAYKYKVAILTSPYVAQFTDDIGYAAAKRALLHLGFDQVEEEAMVTHIMARIVRDYIHNHPQRPILSSSCPAVVRLMQLRYTSLLPYLVHVEAPAVDLAGYLRTKIMEEKGLSEDEIGIFPIVPCTAQVTSAHSPVGSKKHYVDGAIAIREIYSEVMSQLKAVQSDETPVSLFPEGLCWAVTELEAQDINDGLIRTLAVSGIDNVMEILTKIENQQFLEPYDYVVLSCCTNGCVGGVLNVENPFVATSRIKRIIRQGELKKNQRFADEEDFWQKYKSGQFDVLPLEPRPMLKLDDDIKVALSKMKQINALRRELPGLDCRACGSPTCLALAEDIVYGTAEREDCVVMSRLRSRYDKQSNDPRR